MPSVFSTAASWPPAARFEQRMAELRAQYPDEYGYSEPQRLDIFRRWYGRDAIPEDVRADIPVAHRCRSCGMAHYIAPPPMDAGQFRRRASGTPYNTCRHCERRATARRRLAARAKERLATEGRRFGFELEFKVPCNEYGEPLHGCDAQSIAFGLNNAGIRTDASGYTHNVREGVWKVVPDGSVIGGWELVSPPLLWSQRGQIKTACDVLVALGAREHRSCGLHVHHEVADLDLTQLKQVVAAWQDHEAVSYALVQSDRADSQWCEPFGSYDLDHIARARSKTELTHLDRYKALNLGPVESYGTVEIRLAGCTLDHRAITAWIAYGQALIDLALSDEYDGATPNRATAMPRFRSGARAVREAALDAMPFKCPDSRELLKSRGLDCNYDPDDDDADDGGW